MSHYPPLPDDQLAKLKAELRLIPRRHKEDALQEAWLAYLEGRNAVMAAKTFAAVELRHEEREVPISQLN